MPGPSRERRCEKSRQLDDWSARKGRQRIRPASASIPGPPREWRPFHVAEAGGAVFENSTACVYVETRSAVLRPGREGIETTSSCLRGTTFEHKLKVKACPTAANSSSRR